MLADPEIEAVYNPLPNHLHVPLTLAAARAGKHVLCEKPIAITAKEAGLLKKAPKGILIAEAFMVRHALQWIEARRLVRKGAIGEVKAIQVFFSYFNDDPANVRNIAKIGGGGLDRDPKFKTDRVGAGLADFGSGRHLSFSISTQLAPFQRVQIVGTRGRIEIEIPFNAPPDIPNRMFVQGMTMNVGKRVEFPVSDQYQLQAESFSRAVRGKEKLVWGVDDAIMNMRIIDAFFRSEKSGKWERP
jgi:predicted dehydrogenase